MSAPDAAPARLSGSGVFAIRDFRRLWLSNLLGDVGQGFAGLALSVTAVLVLHASVFEVAVIAALDQMAYLVLGIPIGVWADRVPQKQLLVTADLARFVAVLSVPIAYGFHSLTVTQLMTVAAIAGTANLVFDVGHTTVLPSIVGVGRVAHASARLQTVDSTVQVVAPGLAGQLIAAASGPIAYLVTAGAHLASTFSAAAIRTQTQPPGEPAEHPPFWQSVREGLSFVFAHRLQRIFMTGAAIINFGAGFLGAVFDVFALRDLGMSSGTLGIVLSIGALGGIIGSLVGLRVRHALGEIRAQLICYALIPIAFAATPLAPVLPWPAPISMTVSEFLVNLVLVVGAVASAGVFARMTPPQLLGRVTSARRLVAVGTVPLGMLVAGVLGTAIGNDLTLWIGAAIIACATPVYLASPLRSMRDLPAAYDVSESLREPD